METAFPRMFSPSADVYYWPGGGQLCGHQPIPACQPALTSLPTIRRDLKTWRTRVPLTSCGACTATSRSCWSWGLQPSGRAQGLCGSLSSSIRAWGLSSPSGRSSSSSCPEGLVCVPKRDLFCGERRGSEHPTDPLPPVEPSPSHRAPQPLPSCQGRRGSPAGPGAAGAPEKQPRGGGAQAPPSRNSLALGTRPCR